MALILNRSEFPPSRHVTGYAEAKVAQEHGTAERILREQYKKVCEEYGEFIDAWANGELYGDDGARAHICEECADLIQAASNMLWMLSFAAGTDRSTVVTAVKLKCVARDKGFYPVSAV